MSFTPENINLLHNLTFRTAVEVCGYLEYRRGSYRPIIENYGTKSRCDHRSYELVWHTHPVASKPFPSFEDIVRVLRHHTKRSFIFTQWGIWILTSPDKYQLPGRFLSLFKEKYLKYLREMYISYKRDPDTIPGLLILHFIRGMTKHAHTFNLRIIFRGWDQV